MKKGFTLAEVLITLAVIGVVAALTIPVLAQKYQKKQLYSQFMKAYNTISTMMDNAVSEYGDMEDWKWAKRSYNSATGDYELSGGDNPIEKYLLSQIKYVKKCDDAEDCFGSGYTLLGGGDGSSEQYPDDNLTEDLLSVYSYMESAAVVLPDGMSLQIAGYSYRIEFVFDTNGKKGPNVYGRDIFEMTYYPEDSYYNKPAGFDIEEYGNDSYYGNNCDPNSNGQHNGDGCISRLLQEGAMNY